MPTYGNLKQKGFTLVEMLTAIFIFTLLIGGILLLFKTILTTSTQQTLALGSTDQARKVAFNFVNEIRTATTGNSGAYPLNEASSSEIILYSGYGSANGTANRIRYFASGPILYKGTIIPSGNPLSYNLNSEIVKPVQTALANGNTPIFYYYDEAFSGTNTPLIQPINLNRVKFVKINLILLKQDVKNATSTFSVSAGGTIRNLKTNLGN